MHEEIEVFVHISKCHLLDALLPSLFKLLHQAVPIKFRGLCHQGVCHDEPSREAKAVLVSETAGGG